MTTTIVDQGDDPKRYKCFWMIISTVLRPDDEALSVDDILRVVSICNLILNDFDEVSVLIGD